jgi:flagellar motor switch protein FliM
VNQTMSQEDIGDAEEGNLIDEIIRLSDFTFDRLPMLDIIGERLVENISVAFPDLMRAMCEASLLQLDYIPLGQIIEGLPAKVLLAVGTGRPFEGEILLAIDRTLFMTSVELMLGGNAKQINEDDDEEYTAIELAFGERLAAAILAELQRALSVVGKAALELDRVETDPDAASVVKHSSLCARMKFSIAMAGHAGVLDVIIPYDALEPIRPDLGKIYFGDRGQAQNAWQGLISDQIERAHMDLEVVMAEEAIPIQKIMAWRAGDTVEFGIEEGQDAIMTCADTPMFKVSLGKRNNGFVAVQITEKISTLEVPENVGNDN